MRPTGSVRQRSENSFQIRYSLGYDPLTGKRKRLQIYFKGTYKEAQIELRRLLRTLDTNEHIKPNKIKVSVFLTQWLEAIRPQVSPKTYERYEEIVRNYLIPAFGNCPLLKLEPLAIQQKYSDWETTGRRDGKQGGLAPRTRLHTHRIFKLALKHAVRMRHISSNPADQVDAPVAKKAAITTLSIDQSIRLLEELKNSRLYWPVFLALATGMRRGEIVALRWKHIDFEKSTIRVVESVEQVKQALRFKAPKTDKSRAVKLPHYAIEELQEWKRQQAARLAESKVTADENTFVCGRSWDGGVVKPDSLSGEFYQTIRKIPDMPVVRFHDLRHSHATQLLEEGIHPKIAQERLGHSTIRTTLDLYSHVTETMQEEAVSKLDGVYRAKSFKPRQPLKPVLE